MIPIDIRAYKDFDNIPTLVLVDLQQEYLCESRPLGLKNAHAAVGNCKRLLECARENRLPVAFVRWSQAGKVFNRNGPFWSWMEGFAPNGSDMVFERAWPSCYASAEFSEMMNNGGGKNAVIAGFTGAMACLATVIEGIPRQHQFTFVHDASVSHGHHDKDESEVHGMATSLISLYARVTTTDGWLSALASRTRNRLRIANTYAIG